MKMELKLYYDVDNQSRVLDVTELSIQKTQRKKPVFTIEPEDMGMYKVRLEAAVQSAIADIRKRPTT